MSATVFSVVTLAYLASFALFAIRASSEKDIWHRAATMVALAGLAGHTGGIVLRWVESYRQGMAHVPLSNFYESLVFFSWSVALFFALTARSRARSRVGAFAMPIAFLLLAYASFSPGVDPSIRPLVPALKSDWLVVHVVTCFLGYAALLLASLTGILALREKAVQKGEPSASGEVEPAPGPRNGLQPAGRKDTDPGLETFDVFLRSGYILFTLGIVTGSVWGHMAWGRYWGWDPKETWALITWLVYTCVLHARAGRALPRRKHVIVLLAVGLVCILFTYFGVNYLPGLHSYA